jgi:phage terminase small subunit
MQRVKGQKLTIKEKKFVAAKVSGKTNRDAFKEAGYSTNSNMNTLDVAASLVNHRPNVQAAIDAGLAKAGLTPEYAIEQLAKIVSQDDEMGAKRLAIKDTLELHGWNKAERPQVHLVVEGEFFSQARGGVVEGEVVDGNNKSPTNT